MLALESARSFIIHSARRQTAWPARHVWCSIGASAWGPPSKPGTNKGPDLEADSRPHLPLCPGGKDCAGGCCCGHAGCSRLSSLHLPKLGSFRRLQLGAVQQRLGGFRRRVAQPGWHLCRGNAATRLAHGKSAHSDRLQHPSQWSASEHHHSHVFVAPVCKRAANLHGHVCVWDPHCLLLLDMHVCPWRSDDGEPA